MAGRAERRGAGVPGLIRASAVVHLAAAGLLPAVPRSWRFVIPALVANHVVLTAAGLLPRSTWIGPNLRRLPDDDRSRDAVGLTFDDGPDPDTTPAVLDVLAEHDARATFFCIGERAERHRALVARIVDEGHRVENHTYGHPNGFYFFGSKRMTREIERAQEILRNASGESPGWFRAPAGIRNPWLQVVLDRLGLALVSWTRRGFDTVSTDPARVLGRLADGVRARDILLLHDGSCARDGDGRAVVTRVLPDLLARLAGAGLRAVALPRRDRLDAPDGGP
jgi:peptidoglycan/xylan/chitin deacetylase (PgdA/CDA1 family)